MSSWKRFLREVKSEKDSLKMQHQVLDEQRRCTLACEHHKRNVTSKCFVQWYSFLVMTQREREEERVHKARMEKIALFKIIKAEDKKENVTVGLESISGETESIETLPPAYIEFEFQTSLPEKAKDDITGKVIPRIKKPAPPLPQVLAAMGMYGPIRNILLVSITSMVFLTF